MSSIISDPKMSSVPTEDNLRLGWIDMARGAAIIMVVLGHAWRGMSEAAVIADAKLFHHIDQAIYLFHMPVFFILSGFVFMSGGYPSLLNFIKARVTRILYPMLVWYYIFVGVNVLMTPYVNSPYGIDRFFSMPVPFGTHLWFLWALFVIQLICFPIIFFKSRLQLISYIFLSALIVFFVNYGFGYSNIWLHHALAFFPFFLLGILSRNIKLQKYISASNPVILILLGGGIFMMAEFLNMVISQNRGYYFFLEMIAAISFIIAISGIYFISENKLISKGLVILGRASMAIYLVHIFFTSSSRIALSGLGIDNIFIHITVGTFFGIFGPMIFKIISRKFSFCRVLGF